MDLLIAQNQRCVVNVGKSVPDARALLCQTSLERYTTIAWPTKAEEQRSSCLHAFAYGGNITLYVLRGYW